MSSTDASATFAEIAALVEGDELLVAMDLAVVELLAQHQGDKEADHVLRLFRLKSTSCEECGNVMHELSAAASPSELRVMCEGFEALDGRELLTGLQQSISLRVLSTASVEEPTAARCTQHVAAMPLLLTLQNHVLQHLVVGALRRALKQPKNAGSVCVKELLDVAASNTLHWLPQVVAFGRFAAKLCCLQDGAFQYTSIPCDGEASHEDDDAAAANNDNAAAATAVSPRLVSHVALYGVNGRPSVLECLLTLLEICTATLAATRTAHNGLGNPATVGLLQRCQRECFLLCCDVHHLLIAAQMFSGTSPLAPLSGWACREDGSKLESVVEILDSAERLATARRRQEFTESLSASRLSPSQLEQRRRGFWERSAQDLEKRMRDHREGCFSYDDGEGTGECEGHRREALMRRVSEVSTKVIMSVSTPFLSKVCEASALLQFEGMLQGVPRSHRVVTCIRTLLTSPQQRVLGVEAVGRGVAQLLAAIVMWSEEAAVRSRKEQNSHDGGKRCKPMSARELASQAREKIISSSRPSGGGEVVTEDDERHGVVESMERYRQLDKQLSVALLCPSSSSSDDDDDNDGTREQGIGDDDELPCVALPYGDDSALCGAFLCLMTQLPAPSFLTTRGSILSPQEDSKGPQMLLRWLLCGSGVTMTDFVACVAVEPLRQLTRSQSLHASATGLVLWSRLLDLDAKYAMTFPGEVVLTSRSQGETANTTGQQGWNAAANLFDASESRDETISTGEGGGCSFRTNAFAQHFSLLRDVATLVTMCPSKQHRLCARHVMLRTLAWYQAPVRCKLLCALMETSPFGSIATALLATLKAEIKEELSCTTTLTKSAVRWFANVWMLTRLSSSMEKWSLEVLPRRYHSAPLTCSMPSTVLQSLSEKLSPPVSGDRRGERVEALTAMAGLIQHVVMWDRSIALSTAPMGADGVELAKSTATQLDGILFRHICTTETAIDGATSNQLQWRVLVERNAPCCEGAGGFAFEQKSKKEWTSTDFLCHLEVCILTPWLTYLGDPTANSAVELSPLEKFSMETVLHHLRHQLLVTGTTTTGHDN